MKAPTKEELLKKYAEKYTKVHAFYQIDGWFVPGSDDPIVNPDEDGDCIFFGLHHDLRRSPSELAVRVQIHQGTRPEDAKRLLQKMLEVVERAIEFGDNGPPGLPKRERPNLTLLPPADKKASDEEDTYWRDQAVQCQHCKMAWKEQYLNDDQAALWMDAKCPFCGRDLLTPADRKRLGLE